MTHEQKQLLFNHFSENHGATLLEDDYNQIENILNHVPDAGKVMYVLDTIDSQREEAADNFVAVNDGNIRNHWDFRQGAKWAIEAIKSGLKDHVLDAGKMVTEDELEQVRREAFEAGVILASYSPIRSNDAIIREFNEWQSTRDNKGKEKQS